MPKLHDMGGHRAGGRPFAGLNSGLRPIDDIAHCADSDTHTFFLMIVSIGLLILGGITLVLSGDLLVRGAVSLSQRMGLSPTVIGLTVVAFGTSAPELVVSIQAALSGTADIAVGSVVGSNIANILLILGVPALIIAVPTDDDEARNSYWFMAAVTLVFAAILASGEINRWFGGLFLLALAGYLFISYRSARLAPELAASEQDGPGQYGSMATGLMLLGGVVGLPLGAHWFVQGAKEIATAIGISEAAIGVTVVAIGTSLPELAASTVAAVRGRVNIALANVIGSNLMNILGIIGITAVIVPLSVSEEIQSFDAIAMIAATAVLGLLLLRRWSIGLALGIAFLGVYAGFLAVRFGGVQF